MRKKTTVTKKAKITLLVFMALATIAVTGGYHYYKKIYIPNVTLLDNDIQFIYIPTGAGIQDVIAILNSLKVLDNTTNFEWVAKQMGYADSVKPGKYAIHNKMNNKELVMLLRSGRQTPVKLVFNTVRTTEQFASVIARQIEADSTSIDHLLKNESFLAERGFNRYTAISVFIPNTYEFYWNTSAEEFFTRMLNEYQKFWNEDRLNKAQKIKLTPSEVSALASIVEQESHKKDERPDIAGVYINRLNKNWRLEADPTLIFAARDFNIKRVLNIHKEIDSPYNTYKNGGLPPGPICIPSISSIDAVLNYSSHNYMFFCAKHDFSGYHSFARNYSEHLINARKFQNELNRRKIRS